MPSPYTIEVKIYFISKGNMFFSVFIYNIKYRLL